MLIYHGNGWYPMPRYFADKRFSGDLLILLSFADVKKIKPQSHIKHFFMDSGAFGAWNRGITIAVDDYIAFIKANKDQLHVYANLDVIGDPVATWENYQRMRDADLDPMPVWHFGEDIAWLHKYAELTKYIGLGGIAKAKKSARRLFFAEAFRNYPDPDKMKFHGFGMTGIKHIVAYPWYSIDSTASIMSAVSGAIHTPWGGVTISDGVANSKVAQMGDIKVEVVEEWIRSLGWDPLRAREANPLGTVERLMINYDFFESLKAQVPKVYTETVTYPSLI